MPLKSEGAAKQHGPNKRFEKIKKNHHLYPTIGLKLSYCVVTKNSQPLRPHTLYIAHRPQAHTHCVLALKSTHQAPRHMMLNMKRPPGAWPQWSKVGRRGRLQVKRLQSGSVRPSVFIRNEPQEARLLYIDRATVPVPVPVAG